MADKTKQSELNQKFLEAISQLVSVNTNYWGEYEEVNKDSLISAAKTCELIALSAQTHQPQPEEMKNISVQFAEWMHTERLTGNWNENYDYFLKNIYKKNADQAIKPTLFAGLRNAK
ncbi:MAG: hypothetical protein ABJB86_05315 [Bacteroidota bacterium]